MKRSYSIALTVGLVLIVLVIIAAILQSLLTSTDTTPAVVVEPEEDTSIELTEEPVQQQVLGQSVEGRDIEVFHFGSGDTRVLLVGGVHGGYEWNSILLAYEMIDYFKVNADAIPEALTIDIIPNLNPDGLYIATTLEGRFTADEITDYSMHTTGTGRFNANNVDLNRNFGCNWAPESSWRGQRVNAGSAPFSEPEAALLRDFVFETNPIAAAFWHSQANNVYASECEDGPLELTLAIMNAYANAANYGAVPVFDAYPITGDVEGWLASQGVAAITVELQGRLTSEWDRNIAGTLAMLAAIAEHSQRALPQ